MKVFIFTLGTRGDVQPYVALARGLMAAGHEAVVCTDDRFRDFIAGQGVAVAEFNGLMGDLSESAEAKEVMEQGGSVGSMLRRLPHLMRLSRRLQESVMCDGWRAAAASGADLIVYHPKAFGGPHFAEKLGIPAVMAVPLPMLVTTGEFPVIGFPRLPLGRGYNRFTYGVLERIMRMISGKHIKRWRREHGMPRAPRRWLETATGRAIPVLHAYSGHVGPSPGDWPQSAVATGYWFLDAQGDWQPDAALAAFLAAGAPPVYVGFGSMSGQRAKARAELVLAALARAGVRGILAAGWGGLEAGAVPATVHLVKEVPHDWLFPRVAAVVHHGGAGTTAAALRAGRPNVICPFIADQPFWGWCVAEHGLGPAPIPQRKLTMEKLAVAIRATLDDGAMRARANAMGEKLRAEHGIAAAIDCLGRAARGLPVRTAPSNVGPSC